MAALDIKLLRDLRRLWAQSLAIALVVAGGVATIVMSVGSLHSLEETRAAYYERYQFADVFAQLRRAPKALLDRIAEIPGVAAVDGRIAKLALLDIPQFAEPASGQFISLPDRGQPSLNRLYMRSGRLPEAGRADEVVVTEGFTKAHGFAPGSRFAAILNGRKRDLTIVGTALSPEFIYAVGPGDRMPDERRFAVVWMSEKALASVYDLDGAFSSLTLKLLPGASEREVIQQVDALLDRYGGQAAYGRKDQFSHAYLEHGLDMLRNMARSLPPIFLLVAAFLINLTLSRTVTLEREKIGLLKALGYRNGAIAWHYVKFVLVIVGIGILFGGVAGTWLGAYFADLYSQFFRFPFLVFAPSGGIYAVAAVVTLVAGSLGALHAVHDVAALPPAVAMQPPAPQRFRLLLPDRWRPRALVSQPIVMMIRNIVGHPVRALFTAVGIAFASGILIASLFLVGTMDVLLDITYFMADRQNAAVSFIERRPMNVLNDVARLPGVIAVEPYREVPVRIRSGHRERRIVVSGRPRDGTLSRIIDADLRVIDPPDSGLAISSWLADLLDVRVGDVVELDLLDDRRRTMSIPVTVLVEDYFGINGMMNDEALARLLWEGPAVTRVNVSFDIGRAQEFYEAIKRLPTVSGVALQHLSLANYREKMAVIVTTMATIYTVLAVLIAFGVVYNNTRIALSERARELASLRVLGFSRGEVLRILLLEFVFLTALAQPVGWAIGYGLAWMLKQKMATEVMRAPLVVDSFAYAMASAVVITAALVSAIIVRERVNRLDLVAVLKTRD